MASDTIEFPVDMGRYWLPNPRPIMEESNTTPDEAGAIPNLYLKWQELGPMILQLRELQNVEEPATEYAVTEACRLLVAACKLFYVQDPPVFPKGYVSSWGDGGVRIEWLRGTKSVVRLVLPGEKAGERYMYYERGREYAVTREVTGEKIAQCLFVAEASE